MLDTLTLHLFDDTKYTLTVALRRDGTITIPQFGGMLNLNGRDSNIHVTSYDLGGINMLYSTGGIFTWAKDKSGHRVLMMNGGTAELHEFAYTSRFGPPNVSNTTNSRSREVDETWVVQWNVAPSKRQIVHVPNADLETYLRWRNDAYNY